jgi:hypothetical protein
LDGRVAFGVTRTLQAEASIVLRRPQLKTRISSDVEGIPDVEAVENLTELAVEGAIVAHLARWRFGARGIPFATAGGGYLRHLHEGRSFVETGASVFAGGGVNVKLGSGDEGVGVRLDARLVLQRNGAALDDAFHAAPRIGASVFWRF